jgi:hypothetical protein
MLHGNKSVCIVASTLPAGFMASQVEPLDVRKIIVMNESLALSYRVFKDKHPAIKIVCAPKGLLALSLFFLNQLMWARLRRHSVVFFHECCLTLLDLLLMLVKPSGFYFPQVTMSGWEEIEFDQFPRQKLTFLIRILGLVPRFRFYRFPAIGDYVPEHVMSVRQYPDSIVSKDVALVRELIAQSSGRVEGNSKEILFIAGKSCVPDSVQIRLYEGLIRIANSHGYICAIKDHPNPVYRLNLAIDCATSYDPLVPSELLDRDFHLVVGVSSTSLLAYDERSISLVNLMAEMTPVDRALCIDHFEKAAPGNKIKYIDSVDDFVKLL